MLVLRWSTPYTWPGYDVTQYTVGVEGVESGQILGNYSIDITACESQQEANCYSLQTFEQFGACVQCSNDGVSFWFESVYESVENCTQYDITIAASNVIGWSNTTVVTAGFPKGVLISNQYNVCMGNV